MNRGRRWRKYDIPNAIADDVLCCALPLGWSGLSGVHESHISSDMPKKQVVVIYLLHLFPSSIEGRVRGASMLPRRRVISLEDGESSSAGKPNIRIDTNQSESTDHRSAVEGFNNHHIKSTPQRQCPDSMCMLRHAEARFACKLSFQSEITFGEMKRLWKLFHFSQSYLTPPKVISLLWKLFHFSKDYFTSPNVIAFLPRFFHFSQRYFASQRLFHFSESYFTSPKVI